MPVEAVQLMHRYHINESLHFFNAEEMADRTAAQKMVLIFIG